MSDLSSDSDALKTAVREKYAALAAEDESCCGPSECCGSGPDVDVSEDYVDADVAADADLDLGFGLPTEYADLQPGERVLDLGSGAGMDAFVARGDVGPDGYVHGVDFAEEMVEKARPNVDKMGYDNVTFEVGDIEDLPVEDNAFDVILSNCVLNLVPDKRTAFSQMHRALRPGGRFSVSDIVHVGTLPEGLLRDRYGDRYEVHSAGTNPGGVNPFAMEVMDEIGIDISDHTSDPIDAYDDARLDVGATVCDDAAENRSYIPARTKNLHKGFDDPSAVTGANDEKRAAFRRIRDELADWIDTAFGPADSN